MTRDEIIRALDWHPPTVEMGPQSLLRRIESLVAQAEAAEREACARVAELSQDKHWCASTIRARGTTPTFSPATLTSPRGSLGEEV